MEHDVNRVITESKVLGFSALCFLQHFDTVGLVTGTGIRRVKTTRATYPQRFCSRTGGARRSRRNRL